MVRIGFITEGYTERIILKSDSFQDLLKKIGLEFVHEVIVAGGKDNLSQSKIEPDVKILRDQGAQVILILRDLDDCLNVEEARAAIMSDADITKVIAIQAFEAWFLADSATVGKILKLDAFHFNNPEEQPQPFEILKMLRMKYVGRGAGEKKIFAKHMINNGFSIEGAANHPNCPSATYFLNELKQIAESNKI